MIRLFANGSELVLYRNTSLSVELNNALFASADIEGDITFTFELPVEGNEKALNFSHLAPSGVMERVPCTIYINGLLNWNGSLLLQKTSWNKIAAAVVLNPYPDGFAARSMMSNEDDDIEVSPSRSVHESAWKDFLVRSLSDPDIKFAPFFNDEGYGSDNDSWGWWNGRSRQKIVNTLFYDSAGNLIENDTLPFSRANNHVFDLSEETDDGSINDFTEMNQLAFCPQIRIARLLEIWCRNAGYRFINHLGDDLDATFLQSQHSLDGTESQYDSECLPVIVTDASEWVGSFLWCNSYAYNGQSQDSTVHGGMVWIQPNGWWDLHLSADWRENDTTLGQTVPIYSTIYLRIYKGAHSLQEVLDGEDVVFSHDFSHPENRHIEYYKRHYFPSGSESSGLRFALFIKIRSTQGYSQTTFCRRLDHVNMTVEFRQVSPDMKRFGFNIFRRSFSIPELCPDVTNANFLKTILETFGLCYFVSGKQKLVEIIPYSSLSGAGCLDLSDFELVRETETSIPESTAHVFRLKPLLDESFNKNLRIDDVESALPDAYENHEHVVLRTKTNTLYRASLQEDEVSSWVEGWEEHSGNPDELKIGEGKEDRHEPSIAIPHQRFFGGGRTGGSIDVPSGETPQLAVANFTICSDLYNSDDKPSDIILTQYRGFRKRNYPQNGSYPYIQNEVMLPVWADGFALTAKGDNSVGVKYARPVLDLYGHKTITYKFRIPVVKLPEVDALLRPDMRNPDEQIRFLMVRNVKSLPKRISFQIDNNGDSTVLCEIEAVKIH